MLTVEGTGATVVPTPPVGVAYHFRLLPEVTDEVSEGAVEFWQYDTDETTVGWAGLGLMVTARVARGPSQPAALVWLT